MNAVAGPSVPSFVDRYGLTTRLRAIPWDALPGPLRKTCDQFLEEWWQSLDPDQPIQASGLLDLTVGQLLALWLSRGSSPLLLEGTSGLLDRQFRVVSYLRVDPAQGPAIRFGEALCELEQLQLLEPESIHRLEEADEQVPVSDESSSIE